MINYNKQHIDNQDIVSVTKILKSDFITQGPTIEKFENALKKNFGAKYCSAVSNGTAALHLAVLALGWNKKDIILTTPITFLATSNAILYCGATPEFVDIDQYHNIDVLKLENKIRRLKRKYKNKKISGIIATDYAGHPCNWETIKKIAKKNNLKIINDNCHAYGAKINGDKNYSTKFADIVTQSYHPVKNFTTGEGGSILTNNKTLDTKIKILRSHGVIRKNKKKPWYYEMVKLGYNYRITDIQCALGISQIKKLDKFVKRRKQIAKIYFKNFKNIENISLPKIKAGNSHAYHLFPLLINFKKFKINKEIFFKKLKAKNINLQVHYIPLYRQPYYKKNYNFKNTDFPISEKFYYQEVSLPIYFKLKDKEVLFVIKEIKKVFKIKN